MKITISPENENEEKNFEDSKLKNKLEFSNVIQFSVAGNFIENGLNYKNFRYSVIQNENVNELIGLIESLREDVKDHKRKNNGNAYN